jgi:hypothetical protein
MARLVTEDVRHQEFSDASVILNIASRVVHL